MSNKETIQSALIHFKDKSLLDGSLAVLHSLGYKSDSDFSVDDSSFKGIQKLIKEQLQKEINPEKCISKDWVSFQFLFQFSPEDTNNLFKKEESPFKKIESFFFATLDLKGDKYTRSELAAITREINKPFQMPVILLFRYGTKTDKQATLSVIDRRISKSKDPVKAQEHVLEKVSLIHNINLATPHRAHIEILNDLDLQALKNAYVIDNFIDLYDAWQKVLDTKELNRRFYRDIANWYFWAIGEVEYPDDVHKDRDIRNSLSVIRLLTRLIFVWFLKEKKIDGEKEFIPDAIFNEIHLKEILKNFMEKKGTGSSFYKAILQNLFFATLNTEIDADRRFRISNGVDANDKDYLVHTLYRYENEFKEPKKVLEYFNNIPFLNGGLFECLDQRKEEADKGKGEIRIDCFTDHPKTQKKLVVPDFLFFGKEEVDLSEIYGDQKRKSERVEGIIHILRKYKFTVTENTPLEEDVALDPELLGRVFENLLASYNPETKATARKQTGSFYTPREIVNYMVDESLIAHFKTKLLEKAVGANVFGTKENVMFPEAASKKSQLSLTVPIDSAPSKKTEEDIENKLRELVSYSEAQPFEKKETLILIDAINSMKILDPACGSGAFPMGILHKLVHVLQKLDPKNEEWKKIQIEHAKRTPDSTLRDHLIKEIESAFNEDKNRRDYGRKLYILKNCIYGVDIQPIAIEISKLRFFISLIVDQKANNARKDNFGIIPLPNLENNFVAANTLIALDKPKEATFGDHLLKEKEKELKDIRQQHFDARTYKDKQALRKKDKAKREEIAALLKQFGFPAKTASLVAAWNPYDRLKSSEWFDPEYMFEIHTGFDVVIGNPPYVQLQKIKEIANELAKQNYSTFTKTGDIYCIFYEKGIQVLKAKGILTYITSNSWMRTQYGEPLRKLFWEKTNPLQLINFEDAQMFESAIVETNIFITKQDKNQNAMIAATVGNPANTKTKSTVVGVEYIQPLRDMVVANTIVLSNLGSKSWSIGDTAGNAIQEKIEKNGMLVIDVMNEVQMGIQTGLNEVFIIKQETFEMIIAKEKISERLLKPIIGGRNVKKYRIQWENEYVFAIGFGMQKEIIKNHPILYKYLNKFKDQLKSRAQVTGGQHDWLELDNKPTLEYFKRMESTKLIWAEISDRPKFAFDDSGIYLNKTNFFMTGKHLKYLLSLLNSKVVDWYATNFVVTTTGMGTARWLKYTVEQLPIPRSPIDNPSLQKPLITLVDKILAAKGKDQLADTSKWEAEIDARVFHLYGLTEEEMLTVLNSFPKMSIVEKTQIQNFYRDLERGNLK